MSQTNKVLPLNQLLCFSLYRTSKELIKLYRPYLDPYQLTYTNYITLLSLWEEDHVNLKQLGAKLSLDSGTLTPLLKKLEKLGYIERHRNPKDERNMIILLTNNGHALKKEIGDLPEKIMPSISCSKEELLPLLDLLKMVEKNVDTYNKKSTDR